MLTITKGGGGGGGVILFSFSENKASCVYFAYQVNLPCLDICVEKQDKY